MKKVIKGLRAAAEAAAEGLRPSDVSFSERIEIIQEYRLWLSLGLIALEDDDPSRTA